MKTGRKCRAGARLTFGVVSQKRTKERRIYRLLQALVSMGQDVTRWQSRLQALLHLDRKLGERWLGRFYGSCFWVMAENGHLTLPCLTHASKSLMQDRSSPFTGGVW